MCIRDRARPEAIRETVTAREPEAIRGTVTAREPEAIRETATAREPEAVAYTHLSDRDLVKDAKIATVIIGVASSLAAIYASSVISLFAKAYSMAGAGMAPLLCIGLVWKERKGEKTEMSRCNSRITPWGARAGIVTGAVLSQL